MERKPDLKNLSRREREIMDIVYRQGSTTAIEMVEKLGDNPLNSTVRRMLSILEGKGYLYHERKDNYYIFYPSITPDEASETALGNIVDIFIKGSASKAVLAVLKKSEAMMSEEEKDEIVKMIEISRKRGR